MPTIKRLVLDVQKPINMPSNVLAMELSKLDGVDGVDLLIQDVDQKVESAKITIEGENIDFDIKEEIDNLAFAISAFYDDAFRPQTKDNSLFALYPYVDALTNFLHPIVGKWNVKDTYSYLDQSTTLAISVSENWGSRYALSPHGFSELQQADEKASFIAPLFLILLFIISVAVPTALIYFTKKYYWAFLFLLVIPVLILGIAIIYIIL